MRRTAILLLACGWVAVASAANPPRVSTKRVMQLAMKSGLCRKAAKGKATTAELKKLVTLFQALAREKPKRGSTRNWKARTGALVRSVQDLLNRKPGAGKRLARAAQCASCHKTHK